jgi:flagellin-like hook-associated protein FlgL
MTAIGPVRGAGQAYGVQRAFAQRSRGIDSSLNRLATGQRINRAADDPAGLITSENLRSVLATLDAEVRRLDRADRVITTADGALGEMSELLGDAEALVVANANTGGMSDAERDANQMELDSIVGTVNRLAATTSFNGDRLLDGSATVTAAGQSVTIENMAMAPIAGGADGLDGLHTARDRVTTTRGSLGAFSRNVIGAERRNLSVTSGILTATEAVIRDTDYASEVEHLSRLSILRTAALGAMQQFRGGFASGNILDLVA